MMKEKVNIAVAGATGLVGRKILQVLEERSFPVGELRLLASGRSAGTEIEFAGKKIKVEELGADSFSGMDIALFSAGSGISKSYGPIAAKAGCIVIDNSSCWRMHPDAPLVVPEVNPGALHGHHGIIANPNCSTIQMVVALKPISDRFGLKRVICSTYQSISGAGQKGLDKLNEEMADESKNADAHRIAFSTMFHSFADNGFSEEENKMINETRKIMSLPELKISVTCVRLPVLGGHAESLNVELKGKSSAAEIREILGSAEGIIMMDEPSADIYPTPYISNDKDPVYVGRIRPDSSAENSYHLWVVADNLRKGAATNAVQIAETILKAEAWAFEYKDTLA